MAKGGGNKQVRGKGLVRAGTGEGAWHKELGRGHGVGTKGAGSGSRQEQRQSERGEGGVGSETQVFVHQR